MVPLPLHDSGNLGEEGSSSNTVLCLLKRFLLELVLPETGAALINEGPLDTVALTGAFPDPIPLLFGPARVETVLLKYFALVKIAIACARANGLKEEEQQEQRSVANCGGLQ